MIKPDKITLASASPRRRDILSDAGLRFEICPANVEEFEDSNAAPDALVHHNAQLKAVCVARTRPLALVLGADTTVCLRAEVLGKPADMQEARAILKKLSGKTHTVYTGVALISEPLGVDEIFIETSEVTFKPLDDATITQYFSIVNPLDKAGAYGIQDGRSLIVERYTGSLANIMGLPVERLRSVLDAKGLLDSLVR